MVCLIIILMTVREGENRLIQPCHGELAVDIRIHCYLRVQTIDLSATRQLLHPQLTFSLISTVISQ